MRRSAASSSSTSASSSSARSAASVGREPEQPALQHQQLAAGLARVEPGLLERDADPPAHRVGVAGDVDAGDARAARRDRQQRGQHLDGRRLAGAVRAEEAEHLAGLDAQVDPAHGLDVAIGLDQRPRLDGGRRFRSCSWASDRPGCRNSSPLSSRKLLRCAPLASAEAGDDGPRLGAPGSPRPDPTIGRTAGMPIRRAGAECRRDVRAGVRRRGDRRDRGGEGRQPRGRVRVRPVAAGDGVCDRPGVRLPHQPGRHARAARGRRIAPAEAARYWAAQVVGGIVAAGLLLRDRLGAQGRLRRRTSRASAPTATAPTRRTATRGARRSRPRSC